MSAQVNKNGIQVRVEHEGVLNCCASIGICNFTINYVGGSQKIGTLFGQDINAGVQACLSKEDIESMYNELMYHVCYNRSAKILVAMDTSTYESWTSGFNGGSTTKMLSLRGFCEHHKFEVSASVPRSQGRTVNLYTYSCAKRNKDGNIDWPTSSAHQPIYKWSWGC